MKYIYAVGALVASVYAQDIGSVAQCGQTCINNMVNIAQTQFGCASGDKACFCREPNFSNGLRDCSNQACGANVADQVLSYGAAYCNGAGVSGAIASATGSAASGASSAGASATSAAASAASSASGVLSSAAASASSAVTGVSSSVNAAASSAASRAASAGSSAASGASSAASSAASGNSAVQTAAPVIGAAAMGLAALLI